MYNKNKNSQFLLFIRKTKKKTQQRYLDKTDRDIKHKKQVTQTDLWQPAMFHSCEVFVVKPFSPHSGFLMMTTMSLCFADQCPEFLCELGKWQRCYLIQNFIL